MQILKIASRNYFCPMCGHKEKHSTNHQGEIYCHCKACGSSPLYCADIDPHAGLPFITATFHAYRFTSYEVGGYEAYTALANKLRGMGYKCFEVLELHAVAVAESRHDGETVKLYNPEQWPDQFVSNIGRLHKWKQAVFDNPRVKMGYWLEFTT